MKRYLAASLLSANLFCAYAQDPTKPMPRAGVSVQMPVAAHAVETRAADQEDATVVAVTAEGKIFVGTSVTEASGLGVLTAETVYVKADARAPFQKVLAVLDALRGKAVVLLAAPPASAVKGGMAWPYGIRLNVAR